MWKKRDTGSEPPLPPPVPPPLSEARPMNSTPRSAEAAVARFGAGLRVKGEVTGEENLQIDGTLEGSVHLEHHRVTVGAGAQVNADIVAREVVVYGSVKGNLRARDRIEIKKDGSVIGDLTTARIMIEDGAYFKGAIEIDRKGEGGSQEKPAFVKAASATVQTSKAAS